VKNILKTIGVTALLVAITGCALLQTDKIESRAKGIAFIVSAQLLKNNPQFDVPLAQASSDLKFIAAMEVVDATAMMAVISRLPQLQSGDAAIYIQGALIIFQDDVGALAVSNPEEARLAAKGFAAGIDMALGFTAPRSRYAPSRTIANPHYNIR